MSSVSSVSSVSCVSSVLIVITIHKSTFKFYITLRIHKKIFFLSFIFLLFLSFGFNLLHKASSLKVFLLWGGGGLPFEASSLKVFLLWEGGGLPFEASSLKVENKLGAAEQYLHYTTLNGTSSPYLKTLEKVAPD